jgi:hypothetical protein
MCIVMHHAQILDVYSCQTVMQLPILCDNSYAIRSTTPLMIQSTWLLFMQYRWLKLIKNYELKIHYHLGIANVVVDDISRKEHCHHIS